MDGDAALSDSAVSPAALLGLPDALDRMAAAVGGCSSAIVRHPLADAEKGIFAVDLVCPNGVPTAAVLKFSSSASAVNSEWSALRALLPASVTTPEPIAVDAAGKWFGRPALLMSRLPGTALSDVSPPPILRQFAAAIAAIHACTGEGLPQARPRWEAGVPSRPSPFEERVWQNLRELASQAGPRTALTHGDLNFTNVLWQDGHLQGVIDWADGAHGWPGADLARCRWYLTVGGAPHAADELLAAYEALSGKPVAAMALHDAAYAVRILQDAEMRVAGSPSPAEAAVELRRVARVFIERALGWPAS